MCDPIHDRIQDLFKDRRMDDPARTLDKELGNRLIPHIKMWEDGLIASYELVNSIIYEATKP